MSVKGTPVPTNYAGFPKAHPSLPPPTRPSGPRGLHPRTVGELLEDRRPGSLPTQRRHPAQPDHPRPLRGSRLPHPESFASNPRTNTALRPPPAPAARPPPVRPPLPPRLGTAFGSRGRNGLETTNPN